jgi:hypothetical protein
VPVPTLFRIVFQKTSAKAVPVFLRSIEKNPKNELETVGETGYEPALR